MIDDDELHRRFDYHPPQTMQARHTHESIRINTLNLARNYAYWLPQGRELSLSITYLELAMFWANASVARNQDQENGS